MFHERSSKIIFSGSFVFSPPSSHRQLSPSNRIIDAQNTPPMPLQYDKSNDHHWRRSDQPVELSRHVLPWTRKNKTNPTKKRSHYRRHRIITPFQAPGRTFLTAIQFICTAKRTRMSPVPTENNCVPPRVKPAVLPPFFFFSAVFSIRAPGPSLGRGTQHKFPYKPASHRHLHTAAKYNVARLSHALFWIMRDRDMRACTMCGCVATRPGVSIISHRVGVGKGTAVP
jgi:hypothetical protein